MEEIREFCFKEFAAVCLFWNFFVSGIPVILLIRAKQDMLGVAVLFFQEFHLLLELHGNLAFG